MRRDFLIELLGKGARGEITRQGFLEDLGAHVADVAHQIQDVQAHFDSAAAGHLGLNLFDPYHRTQLFKANAMVETVRELTLQPLMDERDLCTKKLIIEKAFDVAKTNPQLAAALFRLGIP